ncbi:hypothetical protein NAY64_000614 [Salmonella enterica]|nr:hypothetical protein [Salmonella enterica]
MKLIDILVDELPNRGGWPGAIPVLVQNSSGYVYQAGGGEYIYRLKLADDWMDAEVTCEKYFDALRGLKPVWDGNGLPPVGCVVEFTFGPYSKECGDFSGPLPSEGQSVEVVAHKITSDENDVAVVYWDDCGAGRASCFVSSCLKPFKSKEDMKRDAAISAIDAICLLVRDPSKTAEAIYDAITAGDITGVNIE